MNLVDLVKEQLTGQVLGSLGALLVAYLIRFMAVAFGPLESSLARIRPSLPQASRSLEQNKADALARLQVLIDAAAVVPVLRRATRPTRSSQRRRLDGKTKDGQVKALRGRG